MTGPWGPPQPGSDAAPNEEMLLRGARAGERAAVETLYAGHVDWARRVAAVLAGPEAADRLVSESFARAFGLLRAGRGPSADFGPHLLTTMASVHRSGPEGLVGPPADGLDPTAAAAALDGLPKDLRRAVWLAEIEGRRPEEIATRLGKTPDEAASLVDRARVRLRRTYLDQHGRSRPIDDECRGTRKRLGDYVRGDLGSRASEKVDAHLAGCTACAEAHAELTRIDKRLAAEIFPLVLAGALGAEDTAAGSRALGDLPGRTALTVAASVVAVVAIAATSWGLARHEGEQSAAPTDPDSSGVTFGPNPPAVPPTTELPTFPEASLPTSATPKLDTPAPGTFTTPSFPSSTPSTPYSPYSPSTTSTYRPTYTTPSTTPSTTTSTSPTATPDADPVKVWPATPIERPITRCGRYGSVTVPTTQGVTYTLVRGDAKQGRWVYRATAQDGYVIAKRAESRFSGNLGVYQKCPKRLAIADVVTIEPVDPETDPWLVQVTPAVPEKEKRELSVTYTFDTQVTAVGKSGRRWTCSGPGGAAFGSGTELTVEPFAEVECVYGGSAYPPPAVALKVRVLDETAPGPSGTVGLLADGESIDTERFAS